MTDQSQKGSSYFLVGGMLLFLLTEVDLFLTLTKAGRPELAFPFGKVFVCFVTCLPAVAAVGALAQLTKSAKTHLLEPAATISIKRTIALALTFTYATIIYLLVSLTAR